MSLTDRFLRYSLTHQRPIKVLLMEDDRVRSLNLTVQAMEQEGILYLSARNRRAAKLLPYDHILSASYARGDDGDTLKNRTECP